MKTVEYIPLFPNEKQAEFLVALTDFDYQIVVYAGGAGAGKTQGVCMGITDIAVNCPDSKIAVVRKFNKDHKDTTWMEFRNSLNPALVVEERQVDKEVILRTVEPGVSSTVFFRGMDERNRWGGMAFNVIWIDEANELDVQDFLYLFTRLRHNPRRINPESPYTLDDGKDIHRCIILSFNPPKEFNHWLRDLCIKRVLFGKPYKIRFIKTKTGDNHDNLSDSYRAALSLLPEQERLRMEDGEWTLGITGNPCTPAFSAKKHVFSGTFPKHPIPIVRGWDPGYHHPVVVFFEHRGHSLYIWDCVHPEDLWVEDLIREHVTPAQAQFHQECEITDYVDHQHINQKSDKSRFSTKQIMQKEGLSPRHSYSTPVKRAQLINTLFKEDRLFVHERCAVLIAAFAGGWRMDQEKNEPEKEGFFEHFGDAVGYGVHGVYGPKGQKRERVQKSGGFTRKEHEYEEAKGRVTKDRGPRHDSKMKFRR